MSKPLTPLQRNLLAAVERLGSDAYGLKIKREVIAAGADYLSLGTVYVQMEELERLGYVQSHHEPGGPERGGLPKLIWRVVKEDER